MTEQSRTWNEFIESHADYDDGPGPNGTGKRVPYIGWYWRDVDFDGPVPIGNCGDFIGFMENNKWDYPQRDLTDEELAQVRAVVQDAVELHDAGEQEAAVARLGNLWGLLQTFTVSSDGWWIFGPQGRVGHADTEEDADRFVASLNDAGGLMFRYWKTRVDEPVASGEQK